MKYLRIFAFLTLLFALVVASNLATIHSDNIAAGHFDTLIVLGYPANPDGTPSPEQRERVLEGVREYNAGVAPNLIMTGGAAHNRFVEAQVMAALAEREGVPRSAIVEEPQAQNTIQNIYYSSRIMHAHSWNTAEVISSPAHIGRAAMILQAFARSEPALAIRWRTRASRWPAEYSLPHRLFLNALEATRCLQIRIFGFPKSVFLP